MLVCAMLVCAMLVCAMLVCAMLVCDPYRSVFDRYCACSNRFRRSSIIIAAESPFVVIRLGKLHSDDSLTTIHAWV